MRVGLVYLPDDGARDACVELSRALTAGRRARVVLGPERLPHVTLLHLEGADPDVLWHEASAHVPGEIGFAFAALALLPYDSPYNAPPAPPALMAYWMVPCTEALRAAERAACALPCAERVTTGNGDRFLPHATLAIWERESAPLLSAWPAPTMARDGVRGRLAVGVIGENGVYERTLFGG